MTMDGLVSLWLTILAGFARAFVLQPDDWEDMLFTHILSSSSDELSSDPLRFIRIGDNRYPIREASEFRAWNTRIWTGGAAFVYDELVENPSFFPFNVNSMDKFQYLSNMAKTPFCFRDLEVQSVESLIFAHYARAELRNNRLAARLAQMDGHSARQVGKHFKCRPPRSQIQAFVESKLVQCPNVYKTAKALMDSEMLLVCTDQTSFDYLGLDRQFGMVRYGKYLLGENILGKIYHDLHREM